MMGGFAMQWTKSSRVASGAEHQFSHLWDMQHHTHNHVTPLHGFKVGIGTIAVAELYERLLALDLEKLDIEDCIARWPQVQQIESEIEQAFEESNLRAKALAETRAKYINRKTLRAQLDHLKQNWQSIRLRLGEQLISSDRIKQMLADAGAPVKSQDI